MEKKVMLFFSNTRIQGTLSSDILWLEHSSMMYKSCAIIPLCLWVRFDITLSVMEKSTENVPFLLSAHTAVHCPSVVPLQLKGCFVDWSTLVIWFAKALQIVVLAQVRSRNKQPRVRDGRVFLRLALVPDSLFGEWWPVSNVQPNAGERYRHRTTRFYDAGSLLKPCD